MKQFLKTFILVIFISACTVSAVLADDTEKSIEEIHNVTPIEKELLLNKDGLEYFDAETQELFEGDLDAEEELEDDLDEDDLDEDDFDDQDFGDEEDDDFDDEDLDDEDI